MPSALMIILLLGSFALSTICFKLRDVRTPRTAFASDASASDSGKESAALTSLKQRYDLRIQILEEALFEMRDRYKELATQSKLSSNQEKESLLSMINDKEMQLNTLEKQVELFQFENMDLKQQLEASIENVRVFKQRTDILENALSNSRNKNEELRTDLKREKVGSHIPEKIDYNFEELKNELQASQELMEAMDVEYTKEINNLKKFIDKSRETERLDKVHMESIIENAGRQLRESQELMEAKDKEIARLKASRDILGTREAETRSKRVVRDQSSAAADYLIAGDLRDQRRILEELSLQIAELKEFQEIHNRQSQSGGNAEDNPFEVNFSYDNSAPRNTLSGRVQKAMGRIRKIHVKKSARRLKSAVKRGLAYLVGVEVDTDAKGLPDGTTTTTVTLLDEDRRLPDGSEEWEQDLNILLNG